MKPPLTPELTHNEFAQYYWLKRELVAFCRHEQLPVEGTKTELTERIAQYLDTGEIPQAHPRSRQKARTKPVITTYSLETTIPANMVFDKQTRQFFESVCGPTFRFKKGVIAYCRTHPGHTFREVVQVWETECAREKVRKKTPRPIPAQCQYNQYIRDFLTDNPARTFTEAVACWNHKKMLPGTPVYTEEDLGLLITTNETL